MKIKPFFPVFIVLIGVVIYAYYAPREKPEPATTLTPKEYIELVEKKRDQQREEQKRDADRSMEKAENEE